VDNSVDVRGINELVRKIKRLDDKTTRREVLKVQRRSAKPIVQAYRQELPKGTRDKKRFGTTYPAGTLKRSVKAETVPASKVGGNPQVVVRPSTKGKVKGWYRFMVVEKGTKVGSANRGSRTGLNTVVTKAKEKVESSLHQLVSRDYQKKMAKQLQRQIDRL